MRGIIKHLIDAGLEMPLAGGLQLERDHFVRLFEGWTANA